MEDQGVGEGLPPLPLPLPLPLDLPMEYCRGGGGGMLLVLLTPGYARAGCCTEV